MKVVTRDRFDAAPAADLEPLEALSSDEEAALADALQLASEPLEIDEEPAETLPEASAEETELAAEIAEAVAENPALAAALEAIKQTHWQANDAIREVLVASVPAAAQIRENESLAAAVLGVLDKFASRPEPRQPDVHVHVPKQDLSINVEQPDFRPEITVEGPIIPKPDPVQIDVHIPEQPPAQVTVAAATPEVVVQPGPAPIVNVNVPNEIRTIPAEVETIAERDADDLIVRSVTRPIADGGDGLG